MNLLKLFQLLNPFKLALTCQLCGNPVGEVFVAKEMTQEEYRALAGIVDQRCGQCDIDHGTFKELELQYVRSTGEDRAKAEAFVIANPKQDDFISALEPKVAEIEAAQAAMIQE